MGCENNLGTKEEEEEEPQLKQWSDKRYLSPQKKWGGESISEETFVVLWEVKTCKILIL